MQAKLFQPGPVPQDPGTTPLSITFKARNLILCVWVRQAVQPSPTMGCTSLYLSTSMPTTPGRGHGCLTHQPCYNTTCANRCAGKPPWPGARDFSALMGPVLRLDNQCHTHTQPGHCDWRHSPSSVQHQQRTVAYAAQWHTLVQHKHAHGIAMLCSDT